MNLFSSTHAKHLQGAQTVPTVWSAYWELTKPRIVSLLILTTVVGLFLSLPTETLTLEKLLVVLVGGWLSASGAGALNHYFDREIDAKMARTRKRPLPSGRLRPADALRFGLALVALSTAVLWWGTNALAAGLALFGVFYYVVLYTLLLKRYPAINVVLGGGAGAIPALVGWAAGAGHLSVDAWLLFAIVFFWSPPHSWALGLLVEKDYREAGVPIMPFSFGARWTRIQILWFSVLLTIVALLPFALHAASLIYLVGTLLLSARLFQMGFRLLHRATKAAAKAMYLYTLLYLALIFALMVIDKIWFVRL